MVGWSGGSRGLNTALPTQIPCAGRMREGKNYSTHLVPSGDPEPLRVDGADPWTPETTEIPTKTYLDPKLQKGPKRSKEIV